MNEEDFNKYLKERYENQVSWYDRKSQVNQKLYKTFQWILIVAAAISPILIFAGGGPIKTGIAVSNAVVIAVIAGGMKAFKFQENWISYRTTCELLKKEYIYYHGKIKDYRNSSDPEALFIERVEEFISRENTFWVSAYKK